MSQELQDDLLAVFKKHGPLDRLQYDSSKMATHPAAAAVPTAAAVATPCHDGSTMREEQTPSGLVAHIPEPPQQHCVTPSESDKNNYPVLSELDPRVLRRDEECVGGMDMDQIYTDVILREILKFKLTRGEAVSYESANSRTSHTLLDVTMTVKDNKNVPDMKATMKQLMGMADPGTEETMVETALDYLLSSQTAATRRALRDKKVTPK
eukprot:5555669-Ditylum_brightwellii.AAC.1